MTTAVTAQCVALPSLSPGALHEKAVRAFGAGNQARLLLARVLREIALSRQVALLGFHEVADYAAYHFHMGRTLTFDLIRVAEVIDELPLLAEAFSNGALGWSVLNEVTRVATPETEEEWIDFVAKNNLPAVLAEARDAAHHIEPRGKGGPTELRNLVAVCAWGHALVHEGRLQAEGEYGNLVWRPVVGRVIGRAIGGGPAREG